MTINNDILEPYCSFELSKVLKEKGFKVPTENLELTNGYVIGYDYDETDEDDELKIRHFKFNDCNQSHLYLKPTIGLTIEWIRLNTCFRINSHIKCEIEHELIELLNQM